MLLAVTGNPIAHSLSPELHRAGMRTLGIEGNSFRILADSATEALEIAALCGVEGLNITAPFKEAMCREMSVCDERAQRLQAVNTVHWINDRRFGFNTDVFGVSEALRPHLGTVDCSRGAIVLGAGGAARAACKALQELNVQFVILNRSLDRALELGRMFKVAAGSFESGSCESQLKNTALIINTLSTLERPFREGLLHKDQIVLDANYKSESEIVGEGRRIGSKIVSGLDWLIHQSREAQRIFLGKIPPYEPLKSAAQEVIKGKPLAIVGLMGSGKSTLAEKLAQLRGGRAVDLDATIETETGQKISEVFAKQGEQAFRIIESTALQGLKLSERDVLSCGGGIVLNNDNRRILRSGYKSLWLCASTDALLARIKTDGTRPLLAKGDVRETLSKLSLERREKYAEVAELVIGTSARDPQQVAQRVYEEIH